MRNAVFRRWEPAIVCCEGCIERDWKAWEDSSGLDHETSIYGIFPRGICWLTLGLKTPGDGSQGVWIHLWISRLLHVRLSFSAWIRDHLPTVWPLQLLSAEQRYFLQSGVNVTRLLPVVPGRALSEQKTLLWFGELSALVNQLCFLFSARLGLILLIIVL